MSNKTVKRHYAPAMIALLSALVLLVVYLAAVRIVWATLIMLLPAAVAITGIVLCVRRRYR